jgi:hypothetical protein
MLLLLARSAPAVAVLDQQTYLGPASAADSTAGGYLELGQTFTPGVTGTLNRIELQAVRFFGTVGNMTVSVYNTAGDTLDTRLPFGPNLGSSSLAWTVIPNTGDAYQIFDFSSLPIPIAITAGTVMAFSVSSTQDGASGGPRTSYDQNIYAGGRTVYRVVNPTGPWTIPFSNFDYGFKIYIDAAEPVAQPGDFNYDGAVNAADYPVWRKHFGNPSEAPLNGNGDNMNGVDDGDYNLWRANFAEPAAGGSTPAPEPESIIVVGAALFFVATSRSRRCTQKP